MCIRDRLEAAAYRELAEEAGLAREAVTLEQLRTFGEPKRDPVSYTHLDVYKRQLLGWCSWRRAYRRMSHCGMSRYCSCR